MKTPLPPSNEGTDCRRTATSLTSLFNHVSISPIKKNTGIAACFCLPTASRQKTTSQVWHSWTTYCLIKWSYQAKELSFDLRNHASISPNKKKLKIPASRPKGKFYSIIRFWKMSITRMMQCPSRHFGSWKNPRYAKCALVETDSYVLYVSTY